jgi:hypothetical protein
MRVVIEPDHGLRRELFFFGLITLFGIITVILLLVPGLFS